MEEPNIDWESVKIKLEPECALDEYEGEEGYSIGSSHETSTQVQCGASRTQYPAVDETTDLNSSATTRASSKNHDVRDSSPKIKVEIMEDEENPLADPPWEREPQIKQETVPSTSSEINPEIPMEFIKVEMKDDDCEEDLLQVGGRQNIPETAPSVSAKVTPTIPLEFVKVELEDDYPGSNLFYSENASEYDLEVPSDEEDKLDSNLDVTPSVTLVSSEIIKSEVVTRTDDCHATNSSDLNSFQISKPKTEFESPTQSGVTNLKPKVLIRSVESLSGSHPETKLFPCDQCSLRFKCKHKLKSHLQVHSDLRPFPCDQCSAQFKRERELKIHILSIHSSEKPFPCEQCPAQFKRKIQLKMHVQRLHTSQTPFSCIQCGAKFKSKATLKGHLVVHSEERPFSCDQCPAQFKSKKILKLHLDVHSEERPFPCDQCSAGFKHKRELKKHLNRIHSSEMPLSSNQSLVEFKTKGKLKARLATQSEERPFSCHQCSGKFKRKGDLTLHLRTHSIETSYSCQQCSAQFRVKKQLEAHLRTHSVKKSIVYVHRPKCLETEEDESDSSSESEHPLCEDNTERPFSCELCSVCFATEDLMSMHMMHYHP